MELGIYTFGDRSFDPATGQYSSAQQRTAELMEEVKLAEQVGLDVFAVGEHHRADYAVSSPAVVLGAAAALTSRIRLSSAVTVLSSDDPVRVFQNFSTIDLLSGGRAEIMAGRGSFIESFPLFGYSLNDYNSLFSEKLALLMQLNQGERVTWKGKHRAPITDRPVYPRPVQKEIPIWIAIGGTPESVERAATLGLPMALAIIGGSPRSFANLVKYYRDVGTKAGHAAEKLGVGINSHTYVASSSQSAASEFYPYYASVMTRIGAERGWSPMNEDQYEAMRSKEGALLVGSPQQVVDKILFEHELFGNTRFLAQMDVGGIPHRNFMKSIELFGTEVAPAVRKALAGKV